MQKELPARDALQPSRGQPRAAAAPGPSSSSRIYMLDRRREQEVDIREALRALRAYSLTESAETVAVNIKVDMTLKKVRII